MTYATTKQQDRKTRFFSQLRVWGIPADTHNPDHLKAYEYVIPQAARSDDWDYAAYLAWLREWLGVGA